MSRRVLLVSCLILAVLAPPAAAEDYDATIRRTAHGIPHIQATDWGGAGYGYGYAFAQDNLCVMAEQYVTVRGERSRYFGPDGTWEQRGNGTTARNLESDFFYARINARRTVERLMAQPAPQGPRPEVRAAVRGYVAGYNRYLRETGVENLPDPACRGAAWVREIDEIDAYRRFYQLALLASGGVAINGIGGAQPPAPGALPVPSMPPATAARQLRDAFPLDIGSNAVGLGREQTDNGRGMLLGNPHFPWDGTERFYQAHITIPGVIDAQGGSLYGVPVILIGNTASLAWSHTVSTAFRFTPFELTLVPGSPTTYLVDGQPKEMERDALTVAVKRADGSVTPERRTLYTTQYGPVFDEILGLPLFPWAQGKAFALGDANADNFRYLNHFLETNLAQSVREYDAVLRRNQGIPWVNSIAADRAGEAYYADISVVPHVTDEHAARCNTVLGVATTGLLGLPVLDGARSSCSWGRDPSALQPGTLGPAEHLPSMFRTDYVINANDSYWLGNLKQRLEGFPRIVGDERTERTLRTRIGLKMVDGVRFTQRSLQDMVFNNRQYAGELWRDQLAAVCDGMPGYAATCAALRGWDVRDDVDSRGALLFRRIAETLQSAAPPYTTPFSAQDPANTPSGLNVADPRVPAAIAAATAELGRLRIALDAPLGAVQAEVRGGERLPIHGGPGGAGVFNAIQATGLKEGGYDNVEHGSSYVQVVQFVDGGECPVEPRTILTYSQSANRESPFHSDQTRLYGRKQWVDMPFCEDEVRRATLSTTRLSSKAGGAAAQTCPDRFAVRARVRGRRVVYTAPKGTKVEVFRVTARGLVRAPRTPSRAGTYVARLSKGTQSRRIPFRIAGRRARVLSPYERVVPCGPLRRLKLTSPAFGARASLGVSYRLGERAKVAIRVTRGGRLVRRVSGTRAPRKEHRLRLARSLPRGTYRIELTASGPSGTVRETVSAVRR